MADLDDIQDMRESKTKNKKTSTKDFPATPQVRDLNLEWGMANRLSRIINPESGRTVMLAVDHGYFQGAAKGLEQLAKTVEPLMPHADALMPTRGGLRYNISPEYNTPIVLRASGGNSILGELSDEDVTVSMEDALRINASAVAMSVYIGAEHQHRTLMGLAKLVNEGLRYGMPVLAVTAVGKNLGKGAKYLSLASRICAETGAQFVKTYYCEGFETVVRNCPVPIVMAGGKRVPEPDALKLTSNAIKRGAAGVDMGRNIFQAEDPVAMIQAVKAVVHQNFTPKKALTMYEDLKADNKRRNKKAKRK
jgi:putative autoinducer-2 (AI-2) aldolase